MDSRIGTYRADGTIERWPEVNITGQAFSKENATIVGLDKLHFAVIPVNFLDYDAIDALKQSLGVQSAPQPTPAEETAAEADSSEGETTPEGESGESRRSSRRKSGE